jgi:uncharacterized membrane protein YcaP (DUF421 family)
MDLIRSVFGEGEQLEPWQMAARAFCMVILLLVILRSGDCTRIFGKKSTLDNIMVIMLGAVLARSIVGASPFWSAVAAAIVMIGTHRMLTYLSMKNEQINNLINGSKILLYKDGKFIDGNIAKRAISKEEIMESLRLEMKNDDLTNIAAIYMEVNGRLSFLKEPE